MDQQKPYQRLSLAQARERAERLARGFLARACPGKDFDGVRARMAKKRMPGERKVSADWIVFVRWSDPPGVVIDGSDSSVLVNLSTGEIKFIEF